MTELTAPTAPAATRKRNAVRRAAAERAAETSGEDS